MQVGVLSEWGGWQRPWNCLLEGSGASTLLFYILLISQMGVFTGCCSFAGQQGEAFPRSEALLRAEFSRHW